MVPKRHHVMKLYRKGERKIYGPVSSVSGKPLESTESYYQEVDPAELELKAVKVLGELKGALRDALDEICRLCVRLNPQHKNCQSCEDMEQRRRIIADLESSTDLEEIKALGRSEEEIRAAIKILSTKYSSKRGVGETIAMAEYCLGKDNYLAKLFAPPSASKQDKPKEETGET